MYFFFVFLTFRKLNVFKQKKVKRQAVIEIQRAVATAENRALEMIAAERLKMEKMFLEFNRNNNEPDNDRQSPPGQTGHNDVSQR